MTLRVLIVGSGPAAAGAALALVKDPDCVVTVLDVGTSLDAPNAAALARMGSMDPEHWSTADRCAVSAQPEAGAGRGVPEKRAHGSDYPFRDSGQLAGITASGAHRALVSGAYGGYSSVWGAQILPFPDSAFDGWPVGASTMAPHYRAVLAEIPFAGGCDDLAEALPLHAEPAPLPALTERAERILDGYVRHRAALRRAGFRVGRSRLALRANECRLVGMCMSGCPYSLIWSSAHSFDALRARGAVTYHGGLLATSLSEQDGRATVTARELRGGRTRRFEADRVLVACGAMGTTRLILSSRGRLGDEVTLAESAQFVVPFVSRRPTADPRHVPHHTLGQVCMTLPWDDFREEPAHVQVYTYNPAFLDALPGPARRQPAAAALLRRLSVGLGYLPSVVSPRLRMRIEGSGGSGAGLAPVRLSSDDCGATRPALRSVLLRLLRAAPRLDLWPLLPRAELATPGRSYHWGGSFPHGGSHREWHSDALGRLPGWRRIHLIDGSVFPSIAATTFTLTEMANAHRIASELLQVREDA